jgi:hypothetical protein
MILQRNLDGLKQLKISCQKVEVSDDDQGEKNALQVSYSINPTWVSFSQGFILVADRDFV